MAHILLTIEWAIFFIQHFYKDFALGDWLLDDLFWLKNSDKNSLPSGHSNDEERLCSKKAIYSLLTNDRFYTTQ
jgi:hypothetical protein